MSISFLKAFVGINEPRAIVILTSTPNVVEVYAPEDSIPELERKFHDNMPITICFIFKVLSPENQQNLRGPIFLDNRR